MRLLRALALVTTVAALASCGATGNKRFAFEARAAGATRTDGATSGPLTFDNETGWSITLRRANVTLGPAYLNVIAPRESHLEPGRVVGEVLGQVAFDALSPSEVPFPTRGTITDDEVRTLDLWFYPRAGVAPETNDIDTVALDVAGEATKGADDVRFRGQLVLDDTWLPAAQPGEPGGQTILSVRQVRGIPAAFLPTEGGHLTLRFDVRACFRGADFASLAQNPEDPDGTKILVQSRSGASLTDQVMTNVYEGVRAQTGTYSVTWTR